MKNYRICGFSDRWIQTFQVRSVLIFFFINVKWGAENAKHINTQWRGWLIKFHLLFLKRDTEMKGKLFYIQFHFSIHVWNNITFSLSFSSGLCSGRHAPVAVTRLRYAAHRNVRRKASRWKLAVRDPRPNRTNQLHQCGQGHWCTGKFRPLNIQST